MSSKLTRERIELIANFHRAMTLPPSHDEIEELARMALAAMDSEPVAWMHNNNNIGIPAITASQKIGQDWMAKFKGVQPLYRHAQQPVVPAEWTIADAVKFCLETGRQDAGAAMDAWNACRAAMLHGNHRDLSQPIDPQVAEYEQIMVQAGNCREIMETSTNSPVIGMNPADRSVEVRFIAPPGYLMVPDGDFYRLEHRSALLDEILQGKKSPSTKERLLLALFLKLKDDLGMPESAGMDDCEREIYRLRGIDEAYNHLQISPLSDGFKEWIALRDIDSHHNVPNDFREILKDALLATWRDSRKAALAVFKVANQEVSHERP